MLLWQSKGHQPNLQLPGDQPVHPTFGYGLWVLSKEPIL